MERAQDDSKDGPDDSSDADPADESASSRGLVASSRHNSSRALRTTEQRGRQYLTPEIVKLFYAVDALKEDDKSFVLQFLSASPREGTTTVSWAFAIAASYEYVGSTLIIDCSDKGTKASKRPSLIDAFSRSGQLDSAIEKVPDTARLYQAHLAADVSPMLEMDSTELRELFEFLKLDFSGIVLDCPSARHVSDSLALSRYADGTIMVVKSGQARRGAIEWTQESISHYGGLCLGAVFNHRQKRIPGWLYRLV